MTIESDIVKALLVRLDALVLSPALPVSYPNEDFKPTPGTAFLKASLIGVPTVQSTLGTSGYNRHSGIFQVSVFHPPNKGVIAPYNIAGEVATHFKRGTTMSHNGTTVRVERPPSVGTSVPEDAWFQVPVQIRWFADVPNP